MALEVLTLAVLVGYMIMWKGVSQGTCRQKKKGKVAKSGGGDEEWWLHHKWIGAGKQSIRNETSTGTKNLGFLVPGSRFP